MDIFKYLQEDVSISEIISVMDKLGTDYIKDGKGNLKFRTICHGGNSYKLYYFIDTKMFRCFTECQKNYSLIDLVKIVKNIDTREAINFIKKELKIDDSYGRRIGFTKKNLVDDWSYINKYDYKKQQDSLKTKYYDDKILNIFNNFLHEDWFNEEIYNETINKFNIKFDIANNKIIIPHYDVANKLIGIRTRSLNEVDVLSGHKYMPMIYNGKMYNHQLQYNLYGIDKNIDNIKRISKIMIFESEKSVLRCDTYYGDDNFTVACCGSSISNWQRDYILSLGVKEVFLAFDKEYVEYDSDKQLNYANKIKEKAMMFSPYCTVYVLWDTEDILEEKDSPVDKGREVLEYLMKNKIEIKTIDED